MLIMCLEFVEVDADELGSGEEDEGREKATYMLRSFLCIAHPPGSHVPKPMVETTKWSLDLSTTDVNEA